MHTNIYVSFFNKMYMAMYIFFVNEGGFLKSSVDLISHFSEKCNANIEFITNTYIFYC